MPVRDPVSISCQDSWQSLDEDAEQKELNTAISRNLTLIRDDIQRVSTTINQNPAKIQTSGTSRLVSQLTGVADVFIISDTATLGSVTGATTHAISLRRNGLVLTPSQFKVQTSTGYELAAFGIGKFIGRLNVAVNDALDISITIQG